MSASVSFPACRRIRSIDVGLLFTLAWMTFPPSNSTKPSSSRSSEVTRSAPVFRLRSSSWKTSWMPSSRSGPSMAMSAHRGREDGVQIGGGARIAARPPRELARRLELDHAPPAIDRVTESLLLVQQHAVVVQATGMIGVEAQHAPERHHRVALASHRQQRLA